jgi:UDP-2,3-diacylglucosamine pyrophosphatase LpxH
LLIFVSDLHLVDHPQRASFQVRPFLRVMDSIVSQSDFREDPVTLVLLGDIFEVLKSDVWESESIRPWDAPGERLSAVTCSILQAIAGANPEFFSGLVDLQKKYGLSLAYVPGNHDALIGDPDVAGARRLFRSLLPGIPGKDDELFDTMFIDEEHGVFAEHGHELDSFNYRCDSWGRFVPGDAVVIEMLVKLPIEIARERKAVSPLLAQFEAEYAFLHEMDNVDPQTLEGLMLWLECQIGGSADRRAMEAAISTSLRRCVGNLADAMRRHGAKSLARRALQVLAAHERFTQMGTLRVLSRLPVAAATEMSAVAKRVRLITGLRRMTSCEPDLYVAGHTHAPLQQRFATAAGHQMVYLNSGTWRRVQTPALYRGRVIFHESYQEAVLCVHRTRRVATNGRYELRQYARGR